MNGMRLSYSDEVIQFNDSRVQISSKKDEITNFEEVKKKNIEKKRDRVIDNANVLRENIKKFD